MSASAPAELVGLVAEVDLALARLVRAVVGHTAASAAVLVPPGPQRAVISTAGRWAVERAAAAAGFGSLAPLLQEPHGAPAWPAGIRGSIAHTRSVAIAAVGPTRLPPFGVDLEPVARTGWTDVLRYIGSAAEQAIVAEQQDPAVAATILFTAKEAAWKALPPLVQRQTPFTAVAIGSGSQITATVSGALKFAVHTACVRDLVLAIAVRYDE